MSKPPVCFHSTGAVLTVAQAEAHVDDLEIALCDLVLALLEGCSNPKTYIGVLNGLDNIFEDYFIKVIVDLKNVN